MGAVTFEYEVTISIPPQRLFKALTLEGKVLPSVLPKGIKSIDILEGDGGVGTVILVTFGEGGRIKSSKDRVDGIDKENLVYSFTTIGVEGGPQELKEVLTSLSNVVKILPSGDGGSLCKTTSTYHTKGDATVTEEQVRGQARVTAMFKNIEEYLIANPDIYIN